MAFGISEEVTIERKLPEGGKDSVSVRVACIVPFLIMKGMVSPYPYSLFIKHQVSSD